MITIFEQIKSYLNEREICHEFDDGGQGLIIHFEGETAYWNCRVHLEDGPDLTLRSKIPIKCPIKRRKECDGFLRGLNDTLTYESFEADSDTGEIFLTTSLPVVEGESEEFIEHFLERHQRKVDESIPEIAAVIFGEFPSDQSIH